MRASGWLIGVALALVVPGLALICAADPPSPFAVPRLAAVHLLASLPLAIGALATTLPPPTRRFATVLSSALTLAGGLALRYTIVTGGRVSADDPQATFDITG